jgi:hypothetical protein
MPRLCKRKMTNDYTRYEKKSKGDTDMTYVRAYKCEDCDCVFETAEERRYYTRYEGELDPPSYHCPECGSSFFSPAERCEICGEWHYTEEMDGSVCNHCLEKLGEKVKRTLTRGDLFFPEEIEIIKDRLEISGLCEWDD